MPSGFYKREQKVFIGDKFNRLTVIAEVEDKGINGNTIWLCECACGKKIKILQESLRSGNTNSCGCYNKDLITKHGLSRTKIYNKYQQMKKRCNNPNSHNYHDYGGRGIKVCDEWLGENGFINFYNWSMVNGYSEELSIDRIDVNGHYEPDNCRWATSRTQANNRRNNNLVTINGITKTATEWECEYGLGQNIIRTRMNRGWSGEQLLIQPQRP